MSRADVNKSTARGANQMLSRRSFLKLASASMGAALSLAAWDVIRQEIVYIMFGNNTLIFAASNYMK